MDGRTYVGLANVWRFGSAAAFCIPLLIMTIPVLALAQRQGTFDWHHPDPLANPALFIADPLLFGAIAYNRAAYLSLPAFYRCRWLSLGAQVAYVAFGWVSMAALEWAGNWQFGRRFASWHDGFAALYRPSDIWHAVAFGPIAGLVGVTLATGIYAKYYATHRRGLWVTVLALCVWGLAVPFSGR